MTSETRQWFINYYICPRCGYRWEDEWDCMCNDQCGDCGLKDIEPYESQDMELATSTEPATSEKDAAT